MGLELSIFLRSPLQFWDSAIPGMLHHVSNETSLCCKTELFSPFSFFPHSYIFTFSYPCTFVELLLWARDIAQESPLLDNFTMELETPRSQLKGKRRTLLVERELSAFLQGRSNTKILSSSAHPPLPEN